MPILWIPSHLARLREGDAGGQGPLNFIVLQLGYRDLFGGNPTTWEAVRARLDRYSLRAVLEVTAKISAFLNNLDGARRETEGQGRLIDGFFGARAAEVRQRVLQHRQEHPEPGAVVL